jgi:homotetrameric cytidine deaminase
MNDLLEVARAVQARAYVPYSRFRVGCAIRTASGAIHVGANVENAAYPQGHCAERSAVAAMVAAGEQRIAEIAVIGSGNEPCAPCGGCRQLLSEFASPTTPVHMAGLDGSLASSTIGELLPMAFGPLALGTRPDVGVGSTSASELLRARLPKGFPRLAIILGSGLGGLADRLGQATIIPYTELPGFPRPSIEGHAGRLVVGTMRDVPVACLQGRLHVYEGQGTRPIITIIRTLADLGVRVLILTNASGAIAASIAPGAIALIADHINMLGENPLIGPNDDRVGPRFPDMSEVYDSALGRVIADGAVANGIALVHGVYLATSGPSFETPAEIRAFRALGADLVGMSTVPEAIVARHAGLRVLGLSIVTNRAAGLAGQPLSHAETLAVAEKASSDLERLLVHSIRELASHAT